MTRPGATGIAVSLIRSSRARTRQRTDKPCERFWEPPRGPPRGFSCVWGFVRLEIGSIGSELAVSPHFSSCPDLIP